MISPFTDRNKAPSARPPAIDSRVKPRQGEPLIYPGNQPPHPATSHLQPPASPEGIILPMRIALTVAACLSLLILSIELWIRFGNAFLEWSSRPPTAEEIHERSARSPNASLEDLNEIVAYGTKEEATPALEQLTIRESTASLPHEAALRLSDWTTYGPDSTRRWACTVLLQRNLPIWLDAAARLALETQNSLTFEILLRECVRLSPGHEDELRIHAEADSRSPTRSFAQMILFWIDRHQMPPRPPGYPGLPGDHFKREDGPRVGRPLIEQLIAESGSGDNANRLRR